MKKFLLVPLALISFNSFADCDGLGCGKYYPAEGQTQQNPFISTEEAARIAANAVGGGFVKDVDFENGFTGTYYEIEVIDNKGREFDVNVDARSGKVLSKWRDW